MIDEKIFIFVLLPMLFLGYKVYSNDEKAAK
jgi:hypothetical protein